MRNNEELISPRFDLILAEIRSQSGLDWGGIALELYAKMRGIERLCALSSPSKGGEIVSAVAAFW